MFVAALAGFWLGRRYRLPDPRNHEDNSPQAHETQPVGERSLRAAADAAMPQRELPSQPFASEVSPARLAADGRVMIVDDEPINIKVAQKFLTLAGYQHIIGVTDSRTVLSRISEEQPDLVLLDIMMPEVSGLEILKQIRATGQWAYLPVIVVTASDNEETKVQALELGATDFLGKPVDGTELVPRVRNALLVKANHDYLKRYAKELESQTRQLEAQIAQARTDALTGLANRRALDEELQRRFCECQRIGSPLSVMLLDVDHFKVFNDAHGHRAGDEALRVMAGVLRGAMRQMDVVTRYGGEEFLVILPGTAVDCATLVAERTRRDISNTVFRYDGKDLSLTVSIGVAQLTPNEHPTRMLERVDQAMYASKGAGRNRTYWHDGRAVHPVLEDSTVNTSSLRSRITESDEAGMLPSPSLPLAPASRETVARSSSESPDTMGVQCNRTAFLWHVRQRIAEWKRGGAPFCVLLAQVEQDEHTVETQEAGDDVLRRSGRILNAVIREMDLIGRYDHACFSVLLPRTTLKEGLIAAERVRQSVDMSDPPTNHRGAPIRLRVGVAEVGEGDDPIRLLQRAQAARSKEDGSSAPCHSAQWFEGVDVSLSQVLDLPAAPGAVGVGDADPVI